MVSVKVVGRSFKTKMNVETVSLDSGVRCKTSSYVSSGRTCDTYVDVPGPEDCASVF